MQATCVLTNARIYTLDPNRPWATALALRDNRILAVGAEDDMRALMGPGSEQIDLDGCTVTPGLVDAHVHFSGFARSLFQVDLLGLIDLDEAYRRIRERAAGLPAGAWLEGRGWTTGLMPGNRFPTAGDLDRLVGDRPAFLRDKSGHAGWANSRALQSAGITADSPDPAGGQIQRDAAGRATGVLFETAMDLVRSRIPDITVDRLAEMMGKAQDHAWRAGLVGLHDFDGRDCFQALQLRHARGELGLRVVKNIPAARLAHAIGVGLRSGFGDDWLRIGGVKIFADGALGPRTALMIEPYEGDPANRGIAVTDKEEMMAIASAASAHGLSVTIHAIGDRANHDVLDVYEAVRAEERGRGVPAGQGPRHRIEHVQIIHPRDQDRLAELQVIASMQPLHATSDMILADRHWGDRAQHSYAWRTLLQTGALLVFGSDCPVEPIEPLLGIYAAVTRNRPDGSAGAEGWYPAQKLTMAETIHGFTLAAAITAGQEANQGSLTPGKLADLTLFDRDIFEAAPDELAETTIAGTMINGEFRFRAF